VIVLNERHLRRVLRTYLAYYHHSRCHLALGRDAPDGRAVQGPERGKVIAFPGSGVSIIATNAGRHDRGWVSGRDRLLYKASQACLHVPAGLRVRPVCTTV